MTDWRALPKVELHLHLEGAAPPAFIRTLAAEKGVDLPGVFDARGDYAWADFAGFLRTYEAACSVLTTPEDYARLTAAVLAKSAADGVVYAEIFLAPDLCGGGDPGAWPDYLAAIVAGAAAAGAIEARFIPVAIRHFGPERAEAAARRVAAAPSPFVTGFGLAGEERHGHPADFARAFAIAAEAGLGLTVHAGEVAGAESVRAALDALPVTRIGHGVRAAEDPELVRRIAAEGVTLETCPGSNLALGALPRLGGAPGRGAARGRREGDGLDRRSALFPHRPRPRVRRARRRVRLGRGRLPRAEPDRGRGRLLRPRHPRRAPRPPDGGTMPDHLTIVEHPLVQHKLTIMRARETSTAGFRQLLREISLLLAYEVTRDLPMTTRTIETPLTEMEAPVLKGKKLALVSILRAGNGLLDGVLELVPSARVGFIGLYRDEATLQPVQYYSKVPADLGERVTIALDPMLATGNSSAAAVTLLKEAGATDIRFLCLLAAPEGVARMKAAHPDVRIVTAAVDRRLNEKGYIVPGLGDAGDRMFGTK